MNWFKLVNKASDYIEENLKSTINLHDVAKECGVSYHHFARIFSMMTGYSLKEYIRNRRITLASYEISNTSNKIIDIAFKYGYSSNEAFTRAFKKIHQVNPSEARKKNINVFTHFPVIKYDIPSHNLISLRYDFVYDLELSLNGSKIHIIEKDYHKTQELQKEFVDDFISKYPSDNTLYRLHTNLREDNLEYDYFVGYLTKDEQLKDEKLFLRINKAIRFISPSTSMDLIPKLKKVIYDEWEKSRFISTRQCEIEFTTKNKDGSINFYYIVSIE